MFVDLEPSEDIPAEPFGLQDIRVTSLAAFIHDGSGNGVAEVA